MSTSDIASSRHRLSRVQRQRKLVLLVLVLAVIVALPMVQSLAEIDRFAHETIEIAGLVMIGLAILGRAWCTLYIGGRKAQELTATGPYSISRNPLYMFSFIGAAGVGAQTGSLLMTGIFLAGAVAVFLPVILREERELENIFGADFGAYKQQTPRLFPRFSAWRDMETIEVRPNLLWRTLRDGMVFFMVVPLFELIDWLQVNDIIHPLIYLP
ncbi:isoprenylcysteine carboxylmethyltransferase family protein [Thalassospira sp.]|uniref:methyltransferase family protein n=1 Tax=Thalassospira sp. TaxID=1912094 RepID=UPI0027344973|nr:isoprenylcysteine carboxylmethyltransferase family protein [Thalassospira sp.]MDP2696624.1 isoprenylcysteine carboxylmethyltransferase family protein [Thalassospira sp.]